MIQPTQQALPTDSGDTPVSKREWNVKRFIVCLGVAVLVSAVASAILLGIGVSSLNEAPLSYNSLNYKTQVLKNGDLKIDQRVSIKLNEREDDDGDTLPWRQMYQQYTINPNNLTSIADVSVRNVTDGTTYTQTKPIPPDDVSGTDNWDSTEANHWYIADVSDSDNPTQYVASTAGRDSKYPVEIGWNIPETDSAEAMVFDITMTFHGVSTAHPDVTNFQWEPFGNANQIPIGTVNATVSFPEGINSKNSWAWLHYAGQSQTSRADDGTLKFSAQNVGAGEHLDLVAMFDSSASSGVARTSSTDVKQSIIDDETQQETKARDAARVKARFTVIAWIIGGILALILSVFALRAAFTTYGASRYHGDVEYWREPPNMSPASAASMHDLVLKKTSDKASRQMAASVLSLASKHAISIYPGSVSVYGNVDLVQADSVQISSAVSSDDKRLQKDLASTSTIVIHPVCSNDRGALKLSSSEDAALHLLECAAQRLNSSVFDLKQMQQSFKKWESGYKEQAKFTNAVSGEFALLGATQTKASSIGLGITGITCALVGTLAAGLTLGGGTFVIGILCSFVLLVCSIFAVTYGKVTVLNDTGQEYAGQIQGLERYLLDFSSFEDRGVDNLTLWDRYLVYAAAFGISNEALQQLARANPKLGDPEWLDSNASGSMLYWSFRPWAFMAYGYGMGGFGNASPGMPANSNVNPGIGDLGSQLTSSFSSISSTIHAAAPSSSSGGGFSGGGFAGGGGGSGGGSFGGR
ncbi:MAG: DUF2207 domain-containing protein [Bifidobacterium aquikefiri]|uniref:DUF2207 domain-containing protein n=1 Tax=Bifidobacterium aquikefiri TaxID=1653207 RepID=UPI000B9AD36C|nr:DUF2207 domain-containing protein [Bifidobacterium aquikefiri]